MFFVSGSCGSPNRLLALDILAPSNQDVDLREPASSKVVR